LLRLVRNRKNPCRIMHRKKPLLKPDRSSSGSRFLTVSIGIMGLAGETTLIIRRLIVPLTLAVVSLHAGRSFAQGAFPAPLPSQAGTANDPAFPPVPGQASAPRQAPLKNDPAFPPVNGASPGAFPVTGTAPIAGPSGGGFEAPPSPQAQAAMQQCMTEFTPLRNEAETRGKLIKAASDRHAPPAEACKLIENYGQAELKMMKYVETNGAKCGIPPQIHQQLKTSHKATDNMQQKVCAMAQQVQQRAPAGPSLSEVLGSSAELPEASASKKGGTTFNTISGNVLQR
jgi:hypothetical protein